MGSVINNHREVTTGKKEARSNKWTFIAYEESAPKNLKLALEALKVPFAVSPLHDKDVNIETGEFKKPHWHGVLYFDSLKSYSQVSELVSEKLNAPSHVEVVMSSKGLYDYFIHAENPEKTLYSKDDIQSGCGFDLDKFLSEQDDSQLWNEAIDVVEQNNFTEFEELVTYARKNKSLLLKLIVNKTYFFAKLLDSRRYKQDEMTRKSQVRKKDDDVLTNKIDIDEINKVKKICLNHLSSYDTSVRQKKYLSVEDFFYKITKNQFETEKFISDLSKKYNFPYEKNSTTAKFLTNNHDKFKHN